MTVPLLAVTGFRTTIVKEYAALTGTTGVMRIDSRPSLGKFACELTIPWAERYILAAGVLHSKRTSQQSADEIEASMAVNCVNVIRICEFILASNDEVRICVIGSESAYCGSWDQTYAAAKAAIHRYVENRVTTSSQQLFCVSPTIIADSGMTERRHDYPDVLKKRETVTAQEVARAIEEMFNRNVCNVVLRMKGRVQT